MHELINFFQANATLVIANPVAFGTFAVLFGTGGFVVGRYFLTERIANLESRIARRDDEIEALKKRRKDGRAVTDPDHRHFCNWRERSNAAIGKMAGPAPARNTVSATASTSWLVYCW